MTSKLTITRDELNEVVATYGKSHIAHRMATELLAAMDSDPVVYMWDSKRNDIDVPGFYFPEHLFFAESNVKQWGGEIIPLYRHAQQPVVPATLPCSVELKPGLIIGKGCKTETLLTALRRRADYNAGIDAMTPEERAEYDANIEAFKAMLPQPAPVVPDGLIAAVNRLLDSDGSRGCYSAIRCHHARAEVERLLAAAPQEVR
ncbi:hypothetical protein [Klebsiella michiganensis]|uniref:hypothetical protein n=1 Tax=Klebsiella michiganensis TaxID=1134687 RepID=UPI001D0DCD5D|nr:hypothetical protein [Klebsiella michiganensis]